jgi:hypothetical protein
VAEANAGDDGDSNPDLWQLSAALAAPILAEEQPPWTLILDAVAKFVQDTNQRKSRRGPVSNSTSPECTEAVSIDNLPEAPVAASSLEAATMAAYHDTSITDFAWRSLVPSTTPVYES